MNRREFVAGASSAAALSLLPALPAVRRADSYEAFMMEFLRRVAASIDLPFEQLVAGI